MARGFDTTFGTGTTDVVRSPYTTGVSTTISFGLWAWANTYATNGRLLDQYNSSSVGSGLALYANLQVSLQVPFSSTAGAWATTGGLPSTAAWHHYLVTYDAGSTGNIPILYIDGVSKTLGIVASPIGTVTVFSGNWYIGNREDGIRVWDGKLADVAIWNGIILTPLQALALANGVRPNRIGAYPNSWLPLDGLTSPEIDYGAHGTATVTGAKSAFGPPVGPWSQRGNGLMLPPGLIAGAAAFKWLAQRRERLAAMRAEGLDP